MKRWKGLISFAALAILVFCGYGFWEAQFRIKNITLEVSPQNHSIDQGDLHELQTILNQPYRYLDRGQQSFVFSSTDNCFVLKFFDTHSLKNTYFRSSQKLRKSRKDMSRLIEGYRVGESIDRHDKGLIFVQLGPNCKHNLHVTVTDRFGFKHIIDLSKVPFVIQRKAIPTRLIISSLLDKGAIEEASYCLKQIVDLYVKEYQLGFYDRDHNFMYNTGFLDGHPLRIDLGRLRVDERYKNPAIYLKDLKKIAFGRIHGWMGRHYPQYREAILLEMEKKVAEISDRQIDSLRN